MPDATLLFEHRHPVEGWVRFLKDADVVKVECRWPADLDTDEWIFIGNRVALDDYVTCLDELVATKHGRARGVEDGFVEFASTHAGATQLEMCDFAPHAPTRLSVILPEEPGSLGHRLRDALDHS
jgi:hypothetical protein